MSSMPRKLAPERSCRPGSTTTRGPPPWSGVTTSSALAVAGEVARRDEHAAVERAERVHREQLLVLVRAVVDDDDRLAPGPEPTARSRTPSPLKSPIATRTPPVNPEKNGSTEKTPLSQLGCTRWRCSRQRPFPPRTEYSPPRRVHEQSVVAQVLREGRGRVDRHSRGPHRGEQHVVVDPVPRPFGLFVAFQPARVSPPHVPGIHRRGRRGELT